MIELLCLLLGGVIGATLVFAYYKVKTGYGYFKLNRLPDFSNEDDVYTINIRIIPDQKLIKKNRIVLTRE